MSAALSLDDAAVEHGKDTALLAVHHAFWREGDLSYFLSDIQLRARELVYTHPSRRKVMETNRRFGKTRTCVTISFERALAFPGVRIPYAAPSATQVRNFVAPPMLMLASQAPDDIAPEQVKGEWVFPPLQWYDAAGNPVATQLDGGVELARFKGRAADERLVQSRVAPHGCEDNRKANSLRGTGTVFAVIDEARDIPILKYVLGSVVGPMLWEARSRWHEQVLATMLIATTTPDDDEHAYVEVAEEAESKGAHFHATIYDCDHLDEQDIAAAREECGGEDTVQWQVEALARRVRDPEKMAIAEFTDACVGEVARPRYFVPCVIGDHGHSDMTVIAFGYYDFARDLYVIEDEYADRRVRSDVISDAVAAKEREL